jgi:hypothetical protein
MDDGWFYFFVGLFFLTRVLLNLSAVGIDEQSVWYRSESQFHGVLVFLKVRIIADGHMLHVTRMAYCIPRICEPCEFLTYFQ